MKHTITAIFLSPLLDIRDDAPLNLYDPAYYLSTYSGDQHREEYRNWTSGDFVLLEYSQDVPQALVDYLQSRPNFVEHYSPQKGKIMFVFRLTKDVKERYTDKILAGKYSEADKQVVDKYFPNDPSHFRYGNRLIIEKSERWREYWETKIGLPLPVDAEVYPRPQAKNEVYGYVPNPDNTPKSGEQRTLIKPAI